MNVTVIGDVHGHIKEYKEITDQCNISICVGDFGFEKEWDWHEQHVQGYNHFINMGNHDYLPYVDDHYVSLGNWNYFDKFDIFTVRGADSIDKVHRREGVDWFANEELNYAEGLEAFDAYIKYKPKIVISHDCPQSVMVTLFGYPEKSQTRQLIEHFNYNNFYLYEH